MVPYQIYQALSDQRNRELEARARRNERTWVAQVAPTGMTKPSSRPKQVVARLVRLAHARGGAGAGSTTTSTSGAGPMGCAA